ncbi:hypothetical protein [Kitasatospora sp. NPDC001175]|uniref:hypothetical protein n=1 Tax=Kitasatospora sp. NPDC001175 TaxID=3157103 RepID=UPI003CFE5C82
MPAKNSPPPEPDPAQADAPAKPGASPSPEPTTPAAFEYAAGFDTVYVSVPLTAHPDDHRGPATVYAWPDGAPQDGRWQPTTLQPNQAPDNAGPQLKE